MIGFGCSKKLQIPWNLFSWLVLYWELHGIYFRDGQIWKVAKGNNWKNKWHKRYLFQSKLRYIKLITIFKVLYLRAHLLSCTFKSMFTQLCDKTTVLFYFLVVILQLHDRNSKTNENIGRKISRWIQFQ